MKTLYHCYRVKLLKLNKLLLFILSFSISSASAADVASGTDLIFLIDQSGSMMGMGQSTAKNDLHGRRFAVLKALKRHLLQSSIAGFTNRISVVEFGGRNAKHAAFRPQLTVSRKQVNALAPGQKIIEIGATIDAAFYSLESKFRGDTDIAAALELAAGELNYYAANPPVIGAGSKAGPRKRIVSLITDGAPYAIGVSEGELIAEIEFWTEKNLKNAEFSVFTVFGLNDETSNYWDRWGVFWRRLASRDSQSPEGLAFFIHEDDDAMTRIGEVLTDLINPGATASSDDYYTAPAYLKGLEFIVDYYEPYLPDSKIDIRDPADRRLTLTDTKETFGTIFLPYPQPGTYKLRNAKSEYRVQVLPTYEEAKLKRPLSAIRQHSEEVIQYRLGGRGSNGLFKPHANLPPVDFELELREPDGNIRILPMQYDDLSEDVVSRDPVIFDIAGRYDLLFRGQTQANDGSTATIYKSSQSIQVDNSIPVQVAFESPIDGSMLSLHNGRSLINVKLRFTNVSSGGNLKVDQVLTSGSQIGVGYLRTEPRDDIDDPLSEFVPLIEDGESLTAELPIDFGGIRWDLLTTNENIRLYLNAEPSVWQQDVHYVGIAGSNDRTLGPELEITQSWRSLLILALVAVGIVAILVIVWFKWGIPLLILRSDRKYKRVPRLSYTVPRNPNCTKEWSLKGVRTLNPASLVTLASGEHWTIQRFKLKRISKPGNKVIVKLTYRTRSAKKGYEKLVLEAIDDNGTPPRSRVRIKGLPDDQAADFVLFVGKTTND